MTVEWEEGLLRAVVLLKKGDRDTYERCGT